MIIDTGIDSTHPDLCVTPTKDGRSRMESVICWALNKHRLQTYHASTNFALDIEWQDNNGNETHYVDIANGVDNKRGVVVVSTQVTLHRVNVLTALEVENTFDIAAGIEYTAK